MTADLIRRLRSYVESEHYMSAEGLCAEAADALAAQQAPAEGGDLRARFEAWYTEVEGPRVVSRGLLERVQAGPFAGDYRDGRVQGAWNVWQAAIASNPQPKGAAPAPMTREQIDACWAGQMPSGWAKSLYDISRCVEAARDAQWQAALASTQAPAPAPEPVAWCQLAIGGKSIAYFDGKPMVMVGPMGNQIYTTPLYLHPSQAPAVAHAAPEPIRCPERLKNGGTCPHHNLQCGWPACNKETP